MRDSVPRALLVYPEFPPSYWGFRYALELLGKRSSMPPLGLLTVAAMFPTSWELRLVDLNVEPLDDSSIEWADLVLTSTMIVQQRSLREILAQCKALGKPVAAGGPHPTSFFCDSGAVAPRRRMGVTGLGLISFSGGATNERTAIDCDACIGRSGNHRSAPEH
jgi:hypothetical protein